MEGKISKLIHAQLEQDLSQHIQSLYLNQLGHEPSSVSCQLIDKTLTITVEDPITQPEKLLIENGKHELAQEVRSTIYKALQPLLKALIEEAVGVDVVELLGSSEIQTGYVITIAVLVAPPQTPSFLSQATNDI